MAMRYLFLAAALLALTACSEPRRTPDGHLMDRPPVAAYGDNVTTHNADADAESAEDE
jgi:uncharacterized lipoprotein YajG